MLQPVALILMKKTAKMKLPIIRTHTARLCCAVACFSLAISANATLSLSDFPDLGPLGDLTELGHPLVEIPNTDANSNFTRMTVVRGTVFSDSALVSNQSQVLSASAALAALIPNQTISANQTDALSYDVNSGQVEVVDLNGGLNLNSQNITLAGDGDLVLNINGSLSLDGSSGIFGNPNHIYINYQGDSTIMTRFATTIDGLVLDPFAPAVLNGNWNRGFYGTLSGPTADEVPEPGNLVLIGFASFLCHIARRRLCGLRG
jgi:hypothetical protein